MSFRRPATRYGKAFSLVELLVSVTILSIILLILLSITDHASKTWRYTSSKIEEFRAARTAFETITRRLSQATLNTYWDYVDQNGNARTNANSATFTPARYGRQSELRFISGPTEQLAGATSPPRPLHGVFFQAPLGYVDDLNYKGLDNLLNTWGYFLEFNSDAAWKPGFLPNVQPRYRFRLMEFMQPANGLTIYSHASGNPLYKGKDWFADAFTSGGPVHVVAENIVALVLLPKLSTRDDADEAELAPDYSYDSTVEKPDPKMNPKNQLPPVVQVTLVAIDEASAARLETLNGVNMPELGFENLFTDAAKLREDLTSDANSGSPSLEKTLIEKKLNYRVFTNNVSIRAAKWSTE